MAEFMTLSHRPAIPGGINMAGFNPNKNQPPMVDWASTGIQRNRAGLPTSLIITKRPTIDNFGTCAGPKQFTPDGRGNVSIQDCIFFLNNQELLSTTGIHNFWARFNRVRSASELYFTTSQNGRSKVSLASVQIESPD